MVGSRYECFETLLRGMEDRAMQTVPEVCLTESPRAGYSSEERSDSGTSRPDSAAVSDEFGVPFAPEPEEEPEPEQEPELEAAAFTLSGYTLPGTEPGIPAHVLENVVKLPRL